MTAICELGTIRIHVYICITTTGYSWTDLRTESQCGNRNLSVIFLLVLQRNVNGIEKYKR